MAEESFFGDTDFFAGLSDFFQQLTSAAGGGQFNFDEAQLAAFSDILPVLGFAMQLKQLEAQGKLSEAQYANAMAEISQGQGPMQEALEKMQLEQATISRDIAHENLLGAQESTKQAKEYALARGYETMAAKDSQAMNRAQMMNLMGLTNFPGFQRPSRLIGARPGDMTF